VEKAKAALDAALRLKGRLGPDVYRVHVERAQAHLDAVQARLRPAHRDKYHDNVWVTTLTPHVSNRRLVAHHCPPDDILALFPRVEPVWVGPAEDRSATPNVRTAE